MYSVSELREKQDWIMDESLYEPAACLVPYSLSHTGGAALPASIPTTRHSQEVFVCVYVCASIKLRYAHTVEEHTPTNSRKHTVNHFPVSFG